MTEQSMPVSGAPSLPRPAEAGRERYVDGWLKEDRSYNRFAWEKYRSPLRGRARYEAISYLAERDGHRCCFDNQPVENVHSLDINHINRDTKDNQRWNLNLMHHPCNSSIQRLTAPTSSRARERVRENGRVLVAGAASELVGEAHWSSREGETSDRMNAVIDTWLNDVENGPFVVRTSGGIRIVPIELKTLAFMGAAHLANHPKVRRGSNITVERYLWRRSFGSSRNELGMLKIEVDVTSGEKMVTYQGKNRFLPEQNKEDQSE